MAFSNPSPNGANPKPPHKIAFVIDGVVADTIHAPDRLAAVLLSEPIMIRVPDELEPQVIPGWKYDSTTNEFIDDKEWQLRNEDLYTNPEGTI